LRHFEPVFCYAYTAEMEDKLDRVARGEMKWNDVCSECSAFLKDAMRRVRTEMGSGAPVKIDDAHNLVFSKNGPLIECVAGAAADNDATKKQYKRLKPGLQLDMVRLREGGYTVAELVEIPNECLGEYEGSDLLLKHGKYGYYVQWGEQRASIKHLKLPPPRTLDQVTFAEVVAFLAKPTTAAAVVAPAEESSTNTTTTSSTRTSTILRQVTPCLSVRRGKSKYGGGQYLFLKTADMSRPKMVSLRKFCAADPLTCDAALLIDFINGSVAAAGDDK